MEEKIILIVDDDPTILKLETKILEAEGYTVHSAKDADEALQMVSDTKYSLIITDIMMPGMDGYEFTRKLKEPNNPSKDIPVIMVTAKTGDTDMELGFAAGAFTYLKKPFKREALLTTVKMMIPPPEKKKAPSSEEEPKMAFKPTVTSAKKKDSADEADDPKNKTEGWFKKLFKK